MNECNKYSFFYIEICFFFILKYMIITNKTKTNAYNQITKCLIEFYQSQSVCDFFNIKKNKNKIILIYSFKKKRRKLINFLISLKNLFI